MKKHLSSFVVILAVASGSLMLWLAWSGSAEATNAATAVAADAVAKGSKLTFLELGSVGCKPCDAMVPVLEAARKGYGDQVEVIFHDVRKNPDIAVKWRAVLIPTQVFLDGEGREYFRHEGYYALEDVVKALKKGGLR